MESNDLNTLIGIVLMDKLISKFNNYILFNLKINNLN